MNEIKLNTIIDLTPYMKSEIIPHDHLDDEIYDFMRDIMKSKFYTYRPGDIFYVVGTFTSPFKQYIGTYLRDANGDIIQIQMAEDWIYESPFKQDIARYLRSTNNGG